MLITRPPALGRQLAAVEGPLDVDREALLELGFGDLT